MDDVIKEVEDKCRELENSFFDLQMENIQLKSELEKLRRDEEVSLTVLNKICAALDANIGDIMDFVPDIEN